MKDSVTDIYFRFIQFSLGIYEGKEFLDGSALKGFDWNAFYEFAKKQTLVGVVFDFFAGTVERAPMWWQRHGLEWLYRLLKEPKRMWRRYIIGNALFLWNILKEKC